MADNDPFVAQSNEPFDRLTELCAEMTVPLGRDENDDVKAIVFLSDHVTGGIQLHGYDHAAEGMADLLVHMKAVFQSMGKDLQFVTIPETPEGLM